MIEDYMEFMRHMNDHCASIYKWVYAAEINYSYDPRDDEPYYEE